MLHARLEEVFRRVFDDHNVVLTDEMTVKDLPEWDSVTHINLMFSIEQTFDIRFTGNELAEMKNVGELKLYLEERGCG